MPRVQRGITTHVVTEVGSNGCASRTIKYLMAIALGIHPVSHQWLVDSLKKRKLLDAAPYLVQGDPYAYGAAEDSLNAHGATGKGLFANMVFHLFGDFEPPAPKARDVRTLIEYADGTLAQSLPSRKPRSGKDVVIVVGVDYLPARLTRSKFPVVTPGFVLDSLSKYSVLEVAGYAPSLS